MPSKAFTNLTNRLKDISQLLDAHELKVGDTPGRKYEVEALNRAGVVLLSAHLEGFVEDLFQEAIHVLQNKAVKMGAVPERLRAAQLESDVMRPISVNDHRQANERVCKLAPAVASLWNPASVADATNLSATPILKQMSNPGTKEIDGLFWYFGIEKVMDTISWQKAGNVEVKKNINQLVGKRNQIAHGTTAVKVHKSDVERYLKYVQGVAKALNDRLHSELTTILKTAPW